MHWKVLLFPRLLTLLLSFKDALYTNSERAQFKSISSYSGQEVYSIAAPSMNDFLLLIFFLLWKVQGA